MQGRGHETTIVFDKGDVEGGDILFLVSCGHIVGDKERGRFRATLVLHASELPRGRGWSPHIWSIVDGATSITVCLLEAADPVDTGDVWLRTTFPLEGHELLPEINEKLFAAELELMTAAVEQYCTLKGIPQAGDAGPSMKKRTPAHSRLDPTRSIAEQFDLLRVVDNDRYPAFFDHRGKRYTLRIEKSDDA
ncbi:MAG TPA: formyltransferase family protein [Gemmatimonadaceae bacterium]|nr:formyltransferase family protein [Gemmatimonadaceae bacterium]